MTSLQSSQPQEPLQSQAEVCGEQITCPKATSH
ncbi:hypothetical protein LEMLEM_LOCUS23701 [Lemmus lemmus]